MMADRPMKAYHVDDPKKVREEAYIIFAATRGQAIRYALDHCDGTWDWYTFTELRATRAPALDGYYRGEREMVWNDERDRVAMVRYAGFHCIEPRDGDCPECPAREWCDEWERRQEDDP